MLQSGLAKLFYNALVARSELDGIYIRYSPPRGKDHHGKRRHFKGAEQPDHSLY